VVVAEQHSGITQQQVSRWRKLLEDQDQYRERLRLAAFRKAGLEPELTNRPSSGEFEWYTPERYITAAREVMGGIGLDPATHATAQQTVQATRHFTAADDGLQHEWQGRVWLNPSYAQPLMSQFVGKLVHEFTAGRVSQAIMLTHNYTDTAWFHDAQAVASLLCFTRGRGIHWVIIGGESGPQRRPVHLDWLRSLRDQCLAERVACFVKQVDGKEDIPDDLMVRQWPAA
jgi:hypothetical protein